MKKIKKIALVSTYVDDADGKKFDDSYMENFICNDDHFFHRIAKSLMIQDLEPVVILPSVIKETKIFQHKYGHSIIRVHAKIIPFLYEPIVYSPELVKKIQEYDLCHFVAGYYIMYKVPDLFDYCVSKLHDKLPIVVRWAGGNHKWLFPIRKEIKKKAIQRCHKIICSGQNEIKVLNKEFKIPRKKIDFLINPIDLSKFKKREKTDACEKLNYDPKFQYILFVGRLIESKGIKNILTAFNEILKKRKHTKLIFIGNGPLEIEIKEFMKKNNLHDSIELKKHMSHNEICYYYNIASALLNVGDSGGLANIIIEAIASDLPVIATNVGATKDFVNENLGTGILIESNDVKILKSAINNVLDGIKNNRFEKQILEQLTFESFGKRLIEIYKDACCLYEKTI